MARRGLSTSEKLASGNPAVRREGKKEAAKQTSSQRSRTISKAKTIATKYSGTVDPSKVEGPSQAQIKTAEQTPKTAGEAVRMAREFEGTPAQQQEYLRVISEKATRRQVATQQFVTRAQPTREPARPEATMTRRTAEQVVRFTPGGGQYTRYATPQQRMERPTPATISAAPSWLATQTRLAKERDKFYARKDLPKYKQPPKKEPYVPAEYMPKTFLQKADEYVISKGTYKIRPEGKVPITEALKGTKIYPSIKKYEAKYVEPVQRFKKQLRTEIETKPATFVFKTGATAAASFTIGTALTALPAGAATTAIKTGTTAAGLGLAAGTVGSGYLRVKATPKGQKAEQAAKEVFDVLPVATGLLIGGAATRAYAPTVKEYVTTRVRYYKTRVRYYEATGKELPKPIKGRLPLKVDAPTTPYRLTRAGATYTFSRQGVPTGKQTRLKPMSASEAAYLSQAAREYTKPAISAKVIKSGKYPRTVVRLRELKPVKGRRLVMVQRPGFDFYITHKLRKQLKPPSPKGKIEYWASIKGEAKDPFRVTPTMKTKTTKLGKLSKKVGGFFGLQTRPVTEAQLIKGKPISVGQEDLFAKYGAKYYTRTFKPTTTVSSYYRALKPAYTVKTLFGSRSRTKDALRISPISIALTKAVTKPMLDIVPIQRTRGIQSPAMKELQLPKMKVTQRRALVPAEVAVPRLTPDLTFPDPGIGRPGTGRERFRDFTPRTPPPTIKFAPYRPLRRARLKKAARGFRTLLKQPKAYAPTLRARIFRIKAPKGIEKRKLTGLEERGIL